MANFPLSKEGYLKKAAAHKKSCEDYLVENKYARWKKNDNIFKMIHENKALETDARYKHRSKLYIPKARNALWRKLAAYIATYFSNPDIVSLTPRLKNDPVMEKAAELLFAAVNYRLKYYCKFFLNVVFACLDMMRFGRGIVTMTWDYIEETSKEDIPVVNAEGATDTSKENVITIVKDEPVMRHVPISHLFVSPNADPLDPINSSPCLVEKFPVFVHDVKKRMEGGEWNKPEDYDADDYDFSKFAWEPSDFDEEIYPSGQNDMYRNKEWQQVEIWRCFVNIDGQDVFFLSLKDAHILTDPEDAEEKFPCKGRPYIMGGIIPDSGEVYWSSFLEAVEGLQREKNAIRNQRRDNITLALNKKILIRSNAGIDLTSLLYSRPGAPVIGNDISEMAVRELKYDDVTSSSYKEEQVNDLNFEETTGVNPYNQGLQRPGMNPTATGTGILTESANAGIVMDMSIINETFMIPLLEMVTQFVQQYETEDVLRHVAGQNGIEFDQVWTRDAIEAKYDVEIQAGVGATSREMQFRSLGMVIDRAMAINNQYRAPVMNIIEMVKDALPLIGKKNSERYINQQVIDIIMSKFGQVMGSSLAQPDTLPPQLTGPGNSGGNQLQSMMPGQGVESGQGFGGDNQVYR